MERMNFVNFLLFSVREKSKNFFLLLFISVRSAKFAPKHLNIQQYMKMKYEMKPLTLILHTHIIAFPSLLFIALFLQLFLLIQKARISILSHVAFFYFSLSPLCGLHVYKFVYCLIETNFAYGYSRV